MVILALPTVLAFSPLVTRAQRWGCVQILRFTVVKEGQKAGIERLSSHPQHIGNVLAGSPAAKAGLQVHDVIVEVNGACVDGFNNAHMRLALVGNKVVIGVRREKVCLWVYTVSPRTLPCSDRSRPRRCSVRPSLIE